MIIAKYPLKIEKVVSLLCFQFYYRSRFDVILKRGATSWSDVACLPLISTEHAGSSGNAPDLHSGGAWVEHRPRLCMSFVNPSRRILVWAWAASAHVPSNLTIWFCTIYANASFIKDTTIVSATYIVGSTGLFDSHGSVVLTTQHPLSANVPTNGGRSAGVVYSRTKGLRVLVYVPFISAIFCMPVSCG
jgi:hypothetical protein